MRLAGRSLLIVEDDARFAAILATEFRERGYRVETASDLADVRTRAGQRFHFAVVDLRLQRDSGLDAVQVIRASSPDAKIVVVTGYGSIATAVRATKLGATNYLRKPVRVEEIERAFGDANRVAEEPSVPEVFPSLARHERDYIEFVLAECDGNITRAAERLGLHRQSLQRKLRKFTP